MGNIYLLLGAIIIIILEFTLAEFPTNINMNGTIITAPNAGLVLVHKGKYKPSNRVIYNTAMFPMTRSTCYLLPIEAARKIPSCHNITSNIRHKRFLTDIVSICMSSASLLMSGAAVLQPPQRA